MGGGGGGSAGAGPDELYPIDHDGSGLAASVSGASSSSLNLNFDFSLEDTVQSLGADDGCVAPAPDPPADGGQSATCVCMLCLAPCPPITLRVLKRLSDAKLAYDGCAAEFASCVGLRCGPGASDGTHKTCRAAFQRHFYVPSAALGPHLHCCWDKDRVEAAFGNHDAVVCARCCDALHDVMKALESFRCRAQEQQAMMTFLQRVVWPSVPKDRVKVLRGVLHSSPFRLRSPEELVAQFAGVLPQVLDALQLALALKALPGVTPAESASLSAFVDTHCIPASSTMDSSSTPSSGQYQPPGKIRVVGQ